MRALLASARHRHAERGARGRRGRARFLLAEEDRASLAPAEAMRLIYEQLLRRITFRRWDVFGGRVVLTRPEKAGLAVAAWVRPHLSFLYRLAG